MGLYFYAYAIQTRARKWRKGDQVKQTRDKNV